MSVEGISSDIWDRLESGERLTGDQEKSVMKRIKHGDDRGVDIIVSKLRQNGKNKQAQSIQDFWVATNYLKWVNITGANPHVENMIKREWQGGFTNMQANRLENEAIRVRDRNIGSAAREGSQTALNVGMYRN
jgi:hypothetical protein